MSISIFILIIIVSSATITDCRSLNSPDHLIPPFLSSVIADNNDLTSLNGDYQLLYIIEHIIKYVSTIKSNEYFIDDILNREKQIVDKFKILKFLNNCFHITNTLIQREINRLLNISNTNNKSLFSLSFTLEEFQEAQYKINNLLHVINERMNRLKIWIPPTMPFLNV